MKNEQKKQIKMLPSINNSNRFQHAFYCEQILKIESRIDYYCAVP